MQIAEQIQKLVEGLQLIVFLFVTGLLLSIIVLALWPTWRTSLYNLANESNFVAQYGTEVRDGIVYLIDLFPLAMLFALIGLAFVVIGYIAYLAPKMKK